MDPDARIDFSHAYRKLERVVRRPLRSVWGQTDGESIELSSFPMRRSYVRGTLLHEALHGIASHGDGACFSEEEDHTFMTYLGEYC